MLMKKNIPNMIFTHVVSNLVSLILLVLILILLLTKGGTPAELSGSADNVYDTLQSDALKEYADEKPRITYLTQEAIDLAEQNDPVFFEEAKEGNLLLEYPQIVVIYDEENDKIVNTYEIKQAPEDLAEKFFAHEETAQLQGQASQVVLIEENNLQNLQQTIQDLDESFLGDYIVSFAQAIFIYNYENDEIKAAISTQAPPPQIELDQNIPEDFQTKLFQHEEVQGLENAQVTGGRILEPSLTNFRQMYPDLANDVAEGDFLLNYQDRLIIYNYEQDTVKRVVMLN